jgi:hypothetical protein
MSNPGASLRLEDLMKIKVSQTWVGGQKKYG